MNEMNAAHDPAVPLVYHEATGDGESWIEVAEVPAAYAEFEPGDDEEPGRVRWWLFALPGGDAFGVPADGSGGFLSTTLEISRSRAALFGHEIVRVTPAPAAS